MFVASQSDETDLNLQSNVHAFVHTPFFHTPKSHSSPRLSSSIPLPQWSDHVVLCCLHEELVLQACCLNQSLSFVVHAGVLSLSV